MHRQQDQRSGSVTGGFGGVEFDDNTVGEPLTITENTGTLPPPETGTVDATGNKVRAHN